MHNRKLALATYGVGLAFTIALGVATLTYPFGGDQANYAYAAWLARRGARLYEDVLCFKPPMTAWVHLLAQVWLGENMTAIRGLDLVWTCLTAATLGAIAKTITGLRSSALFTMIAYSGLYFAFDWWHTAQTDGWMNLPTALAIACAITFVRGEPFGEQARGRLWLAWTSGFLLTCAALFKFTALLFALPLLLVLRKSSQNYPRAWLLFAVGALSAGLLLALELAITESLGAFLRHHLVEVPSYVKRAGTIPGPTGLALLYRELRIRPVMAWVVGLALCSLLPLALSWWRERKRGRSNHALATALGPTSLWLITAAAGTFAQGRFFEYHFLPWLAPLSVILGVLSSNLTTRAMAMPRAPRWLVPAASSLVIMLAYSVNWTLTAQVRRGWSVLFSPTTLDDYWRSPSFIIYRFSLRDDLAVADYLASSEAPDGKVLYWGLSPVSLFVAGRESASKYIYNYMFLVNEVDPHDRSRLLSDLQRNKPQVVLLATHDAIPWVTGTMLDSTAAFLRDKDLVAWANAHYQEAGRIGRYTILHRRDQTSK